MAKRLDNDFDETKRLVTEVDLTQREVVCMRSGIAGWDNARKRAIKVLSARTTNDFERIKLYITGRAGSVYIHSNYLRAGCEYSTKLVTNQKRDLLMLVANIIGDEEAFQSARFCSEFEEACIEKFIF